MSEEIKKLIESVRTIDLERGVFNESGEMTGTEFFPVVYKSDFDRVVEELTKWNKVEDGKFPKVDTKVLVRFKNGNWSVSERYVSIANGCERWKGSGTFTDAIIEWKYI